MSVGTGSIKRAVRANEQKQPGGGVQSSQKTLADRMSVKQEVQKNTGKAEVKQTAPKSVPEEKEAGGETVWRNTMGQEVCRLTEDMPVYLL